MCKKKSSFIVSCLAAAVMLFPNPAEASPACDEHVTGGGWLIAPSGKKANFGFNAFWDLSSESYKGHVNYVDRSLNLHVKSGDMFDYAIISDNTRGFRFHADHPEYDEIRVLVTDNGEPGRNDTFEIQLLLNGNIVYLAGAVFDTGPGTLGGVGHGGGNIQIHKQNCK